MAGANFQFMLDQSPDLNCLQQGDILRRNASLAGALHEAHSYYANAVDYEYFIVLTPTCQLVKRNGQFSSRYITLAAIRPLSVYIDRELKKFQEKVNSVDGRILKKDKEILGRQLIERILHNTQDGYLFLPGEFFPDEVDRIAYLLLSVAIRIKDHYPACVDAKILQLSSSFSAKVGHLTSNLYGQIATEAIEEQIGINSKDIIQEYYDRFLYGENTHWLSPERMARLKENARQRKTEQGQIVDSSQLRELVCTIPPDSELLAQRVLELARKSDIYDEEKGTEAEQHFIRLIASDPIIKRVARL